MALMLVKEQSKAKIEDPAGWEAPGTWAGAAVAACPAQRHEPLTPVPVDARAFRNGIQIHGCARSTAALRQPTTLQIWATARPANVPRPQDLYSGTCDPESILPPR